MSYTYPQALTALEAVARDYLKVFKPKFYGTVSVIPTTDTTASVKWDAWSIVIHMPVRSATSVMNQQEFEDWVAYLLHEMGHPTHTNWSAWEQACKMGLGQLTNALEDVREEKAVIASGIVPNAKAILSRLVSRKMAEARTNGWKPNARREIGWTICTLGRAANGYDIPASDVAWINSQIIPGGTVHSVLAWAMPELDACNSTADCVTLAAKIAKAIAKKDKPKQGEQGEQGEQGQQGSQQQQQQGDGQPSEQKPQRSPQSGSDKEEGEDTPEQEKSPGKARKGRGAGSSDDEAPVTNESELENRDLAPSGERITGEAARQAMAVIEVLRRGEIGSAPNDDRFTRCSGNREKHMVAKAALASRQRALLARALRANEMENRESGRRSGRLDRGALCQAMAGSAAVFAKREITEGFDTDVHILIDASGSMGGASLQAALETGLVVAQAAGSVGAAHTTELFNSRGFTRAGKVASKRAPIARDFAVLTSAASGGTPLSANMARAAIAQAKRAPSKRRVLFVITDGGCELGMPTVKVVAEYLERACGTVMAHVSIDAPLSGAFKAEVMVSSVYGAGITSAGLEHFVKVLQAL